MVFDPSYPDVNEEAFPKQDWSKFYGDVSEEKPPNAPEELGNEFLMRAYVDSDHAGEKLTRRSRTGFIVYLNSALTGLQRSRWPLKRVLLAVNLLP